MPSAPRTRVERRDSGRLPDGSPLSVFTLHGGGLRARVLNFGGILDALWVPDRHGQQEDVVLGLASPAHYVAANPPWFGAVVGRFANRIAHGRLVIDGQLHALPCNEARAHLHGGVGGFARQRFDAHVEGGSLLLTRQSPHGEMGYPGCLSLSVRISLTAEGGLRYDYGATTDRPTVLNLTAHPYFNLGGHGTGADRLRRHSLEVDASAFLPLRADTQTPTGELRPVEGTAFDLRTASPLHGVLAQSDPQLLQCRGLDHTFVLRSDRALEAPAAVLVDGESGRRMEVYTDQPGIQVYSGNFMSDALAAKEGAAYGPQSCICLETQHFPDAPNIPHFPSTLLRPGERWTSFTEYRFSTVGGGG